MENLSVKVLKAASGTLLINGYYEEAAANYEIALELKEDIEALFYIGLAYYKLGKVKRSPKYMLKAIGPLEKVPKKTPLGERADYLLTLIYSQLNKKKEAAEHYRRIRGSTLFKEDATLILLESHIFSREKEAMLLNNIYRILEDPMLIEVFNFVYRYIKGSDIESKLKKRYRGGIIGFAKALKKRWEALLKEKDVSIGVKYVLLIISIMRNEEEMERFWKTHGNNITSKALNSLPVLTRKVVMDFLDEFGIAGQRKGKVPYTIKKLHEKIKAATSVLNNIKKAPKRDIGEALKELNRAFSLGIPTEDIESIEKKAPISRLKAYRMLSKAILEATKKLYKKTLLFYNKATAQKLMKMLISDYEISQDEKSDLFLRLD